MQALFNIFNSICKISPELEADLLSLLQVKSIAKKEILLKKGAISNKICFIEKGMFRCFYESHEKEICSWFMKENDVIISVESFFTQKPSYESIQAIEDSIIHYISHEDLQFLYKNHLEFNVIGRIITEKYYTLSEQRLYSLRSQRAAERFEYLRTYHAEIIKRVPSTYIASYLGITLETLSRIKK
ncbi:MAG: Crp/Fnr family transcriptional regulator [Chitinophagaceae bacterium]|nr:Crp/Fnr family transcriptional regulator [Chitinophagaceae bacterium]